MLLGVLMMLVLLMFEVEEEPKGNGTGTRILSSALSSFRRLEMGGSLSIDLEVGVLRLLRSRARLLLRLRPAGAEEMRISGQAAIAIVRALSVAEAP